MTREEAKKLFKGLLARVRADYDDPGYVTMTTEDWFLAEATGAEHKPSPGIRSMMGPGSDD